MSEEYFAYGVCGYCGTALDEDGQCPVDKQFSERGETVADSEDTSELDALKVENARLRAALQPFADLSERYKLFHVERPSVMFKDYFRYNEESHELLHACIDAREALAHGRCPVCNGAGIVSIRNGDDDTVCPACGDKPMRDDELVEEVCGR